MAERTGLEVVGRILSPVTWLHSQAVAHWNKYIALIGVAEENTRLRTLLKNAEGAAAITGEDKAELQRLRSLLQLSPTQEPQGIGARVIAMRFGPNAVLKTCTVDKGHVDGAVVGTPVTTGAGVVGRLWRTAPHAATVLLLTDPSFRLAVISQKSRTLGIISGSALERGSLDMAYVAQNAHIAEGELLLSSGMDGSFPKGIPVGIVTKVEPGHETLFLHVQAKPLVDFASLEEVLLLQPPGDTPYPQEKLPEPVEAAPLSSPLPAGRESGGQVPQRPVPNSRSTAGSTNATVAR